MYFVESLISRIDKLTDDVKLFDHKLKGYEVEIIIIYNEDFWALADVFSQPKELVYRHDLCLIGIYRSDNVGLLGNWGISDAGIF